MRHLYHDVPGWATVNVVDLTPFFRDTPTFIIQGVEVHPSNRGKGVASRLMKQVLEDADAEGVTLVLSVTHVTEEHRGGLSHQQLWDWYYRLGFRPHPDVDDPDAMVRQPQSVVNA